LGLRAVPLEERQSYRPRHGGCVDSGWAHRSEEEREGLIVASGTAGTSSDGDERLLPPLTRSPRKPSMVILVAVWTTTGRGKSAGAFSERVF